MGLITIDYRDRKLIYEQLVDNVKELILRGDLKRDDFLPSVRSLAKELGINPNTIQKAYQELERQGVVTSAQGRGVFVSEDTPGYSHQEMNAWCAQLARLITEMRFRGVPEEEITRILDDLKKREGTDS